MSESSTTLTLEAFKGQLRDFIAFLDAEKNVSEHTLRAYQSDLDQLFAFWKHVSKNEPDLCENFEQAIRRYTVSLYYKKISKPSLARKFSSLRSFISFLKSRGMSLTLQLKSPHLDRKLPAALSVDEIFYLLDSIKLEDLPTKFPHRDKSIFELIYATGIRCSELVAIKLTDMSFDEQLIKVHGKGRKERIVLYGGKAEKQLEAYLTKERPYLLKNKKNTALFLNRNGTQITTRSVQRIFEMFRKFLKVNRKLTPHKVRHSFATHMLNQGVSLRVIQELLGHKTLTSTEIYTHVSSQQLSKLCDEKHPLNDLDELVLDKKKQR